MCVSYNKTNICRFPCIDNEHPGRPTSMEEKREDDDDDDDDDHNADHDDDDGDGSKSANQN